MIYNCRCVSVLKRVIRLVIISLILLLIISIISCGEATDKEITITTQSVRQYKIVIIDNLNETKFASQELSKYLSLMAKDKIPIENVSLNKDYVFEKSIIIGNINSYYAKHILGINRNIRSPDGFLIKKFEDSIVILGNSPVSVIYGVYYFLETYAGIKFLSKDYTYIPENLNITFNIQEKVIEPRFSYREIFIRNGDYPEFSLKLKTNGRLGHRNLNPMISGNVFVKLHSIYDLVPPSVYKKEHPEYFCGGQLDFTNMDVKKIALKNAKKIIKKYVETGQDKFLFVIGNNDIGFYCANDRSKKRISEGGAPSTPYIDFITYIAKSLKDEFPKVKFLASAYLWSRKPPKNYHELPDNVGIFFSDIEADFSKLINSKANINIFKDLKGWLKLSKNIYIWHYITNFNNYLQPYPNLYTIAQDIKLFSKYKRIKGIFLQGSYGTDYGDLSDLRLWVYSKLLWNPDLNEQEVINDFINHFYGEASPFIKEYINLVHNHYSKNPVPLKVKISPVSKYLNLEFFLKARDILDKAVNVVINKPVFKYHVEKLKFNVDLLFLLNKVYLQKEAEENGVYISESEFENALKSVLTFVKKYDIKSYAEGRSIKEILDIIKLDRKKPKEPEIVKGLMYNKDWLDFQEFTLNLCCGARIVQDEKASDKVSVTIPGSTTAWGISMDLDNLPSGKWKIYFSIKTKFSKNTDQNITAFRYGVYPKTKSIDKKIKDIKNEKYMIVEVGTFKKGDGNLWIAPPGNRYIEKIFVDRVFAIKEEN